MPPLRSTSTVELWEKARFGGEWAVISSWREEEKELQGYQQELPATSRGTFYRTNSKNFMMHFFFCNYSFIVSFFTSYLVCIYLFSVSLFYCAC